VSASYALLRVKSVNLVFIARDTDLTVGVQTAARAPFVSLFSSVSTGGREGWNEGFLGAKSTETHKDVRSTGVNIWHPPWGTI